MNFNRLGLRQCKKGGILSSLESSNGIGYYFSLWFWEACCTPLPQETMSIPPPLPARSWAKSWLLDVWQQSGKESRLDTSCRVVHLTGNHIGHSQLIKQNCLTSV